MKKFWKVPERSIMDFVRRVRFENEVKANDDKEEKNSNIIEDARERRI